MTIRIPQNKDNELALGLERARSRWRNRIYPDNHAGREMDRIRERNIQQISQLLYVYGSDNIFSEEARRTAKLLIDNSNIK